MKIPIDLDEELVTKLIKYSEQGGIDLSDLIEAAFSLYCLTGELSVDKTLKYQDFQNSLNRFSCL